VGSNLITNDITTEKPYTLTIGKDGLWLASEPPVIISGNGVITSNQSSLFIGNSLSKENTIAGYINSVISDNATHKIGLRSVYSGIGWSAVVLGGDKSNIFTGITEVSGRGNILILNKTNGAVAIQGDVSVNDRAQLTIWGDRQINFRSTVRLRNSKLQFADWRYDAGPTKTELLHKLVIEGESKLQFRIYETTLDKRFLYLDDLLIADGGKLLVQGWKEGIHWLLVRKTSANIDDALKKIAFVGYLPGGTHLEDYNRDYWAISGVPEPATYTPIFGAIGLVIWQKRRRRVNDCSFPA